MENRGQVTNDHTRIQESLLAPLERRFLVWVAKRLPAAIKPDHLTIVGFAGMTLAGAGYAMAKWWSASLLIVNLFLLINWLGDSLDGTLARVRDKQRPRYGYYVDHIVDTLGALFLLTGLALSGYMSWAIAAGLLLGFYMMSINIYLATYSLRTFRLSFWKFSPTELRLLIAVGNFVAMNKPVVKVFGERHLLFDVSGVIAMAVMSVIFVVTAINNTVKLYRLERV